MRSFSLEVSDRMGIIRMECNDKTLSIIDAPTISIGGANSIEISFCSKWDGYEKTILFYSEDAECHRVAIQGSTASIPSEVLSEGASFFFYIEGTKGEERRRSHVFKGKIESSSIIAENPDSDMLISLMDLIGKSGFDYDSLSEEDKAKLREGLAAYQKKVSYAVNLSAGTRSFDIPDPLFRPDVDILSLHIDGIHFHEGVDYTSSGRTITLASAIANASTAEISVTRAMIADASDYSLLKGDKGDKGDRGDTGQAGPAGVGISSVAQTTTSTADDGNNIITVTLTNGQTFSFQVQNGSKGSKGDKGDPGEVTGLDNVDAVTLNGKPLANQARNRDAIAWVGGDGVMEVGKYLDFHESNGDADYSLRLTSSSGALDCSGTFTATKVYGAVFN